MRAIDRKEYHQESLAYLDELKKCDPLRVGYYTDLKSKWTIENRLDDWIDALNSNVDEPLDFSDLDLVNLNYQQYFCVASKLNLEKNCFNKKRVEPILAVLRNCNVNLSLE